MNDENKCPCCGEDEKNTNGGAAHGCENCGNDVCQDCFDFEEDWCNDCMDSKPF